MRDELVTRSVDDLIEAACIETDAHDLSEIILTLQSRGTLEVFDAAYHLCVDQDPYKRIIGFRILEDLGALQLTFPNETRDLAVHLAETESDTNVLITIIRVLARVGGTSAIHTLETLQQSSISQLRYGIISAVSHTLSKENRTSALTIVVRALIDREIEIRHKAAAFLSENFDLNSEEIQNALISATQDSSSGVRGQSLLALVRRKHPMSFGLLHNELTRDQINVAAIQAAGEMEDSRLYSKLIELSKWWDVDPQMLASAIEKSKPKLS